MKRVYSFDRRPWTLNAERSGAGHGHWSKTRQLTREWRQAFWALGVKDRGTFSAVHVIVEVDMRSPIADTGNAYGSVKAAIDGLVDAGVIPGDGPDVVLSLTMIAPRKVTKADPQRLTITLTDSTDDLRAFWE